VITPVVQTKDFVNERGGYGFSYPEGWKVEADGPRTNLVGPGHEAVMSMGPIPAESLDDASRDLVASINQGYGNVKVRGGDDSAVGELPANAIAGTATNDQGAKIRFLVIAIEDEGRFYAINIFTTESSDPATVLPPAQAIVSSFKPL
jgi:predicted Zn-dependent protease